MIKTEKQFPPDVSSYLEEMKKKFPRNWRSQIKKEWEENTNFPAQWLRNSLGSTGLSKVK